MKEVNPIEKINSEIFHKLMQYPYTFKEIVECELNAERVLNNVFNPDKNPIGWWTCPDGTSTQWGLYYEQQFRYYMNKIGHLHFIAGEQQSGEDLTCDNEEFSIEHKTSQSGRFWNTNSHSRINESTKYKNPDERHYYIFVKHNVVELPKLNEVDEYGPKQTYIESIRFGYMSKNEWKNSNGTGAAWLPLEVKENNTIEIWNRNEEFVIDNYFGKLDWEYYEYENEEII